MLERRDDITPLQRVARCVALSYSYLLDGIKEEAVKYGRARWFFSGMAWGALLVYAFMSK
jgi:hypothetical protein